jgi:hypothetical protein
MTATTANISLDFADVYFKAISTYAVNELTAGYVLEWDGVSTINDFAKEDVDFFGGNYYLITAVGTSYNLDEMETEFSITVMNYQGQEYTFKLTETNAEEIRINRSRQTYGNGPK